MPEPPGSGEASGRGSRHDEAHPMRRVLETADCVHDAAAVTAAFERLARRLREALEGCDPVMLAVMNGGLAPATRLAGSLGIPHRFDTLRVQRYGDRLHGGELVWLAEPVLDLGGQTVLVVDDIFDEGHTLAAVVERCRALGASRVVTAVLVVKERSRDPALALPDFTALTVPDRYVFGCGMDYRGYWRELPAIYALAEETG